MDKGSELIEKAMIHILGEEVGFEESEAYWKMLKKESLADLNRSRKYRILNRLFELGFLLRVKTRGIFEYIPVPPNFLDLHYNIAEKFTEKLEQIYAKNYLNLFKKGNFFIKSSGAVIDGLVLFFIKNFMKENAEIVLGGPEIASILRKKAHKNFCKIRIIGIEKYFKEKGFYEKNITLFPEEIISDRRFCIIDDSILICFFKSLENVYTGYITSDKNKIDFKKKEFDSILKFFQR